MSHPGFTFYVSVYFLIIFVRAQCCLFLLVGMRMGLSNFGMHQQVGYIPVSVIFTLKFYFLELNQHTGHAFHGILLPFDQMSLDRTQLSCIFVELM